MSDSAAQERTAEMLARRAAERLGLSEAQTRATARILSDHLRQYYDVPRGTGKIVHTAVSSRDLLGKPLERCGVVPVQLTCLHEDDARVFQKGGPVELCMVRLLRFCREAEQQGGLLSHEDLTLLLGQDRSIVEDLVRRWCERGVVVPTREVVAAERTENRDQQ